MAEMISQHLQGDYDLILSDVRMPNLSGPDATKLIRQMDDEKANVPIIALTADVMEENKKTYGVAGMNGTVAKPIEIAELVAVMDQVLGEQLHEPLEPDTPQDTTERAIVTNTFENEADETFSAALTAERLGLPKAAIDKLLLSFADRYSGVVDQIRQELTSDREAAERTAHSLKGLSGTLRIRDVSERARVVEEAIENNDEAAIEGALKDLEDAMPPVVDDIRANIT